MEQNKLERRNFMKNVGLGALLIGATKIAKGQDLCESTLTPSQVKGPFYPVSFPKDHDADLTHLKDRFVKAIGQRVYISGKVTDEDCRPIKGAVVEVWQACASGRYNHPSDTSTSALDPNFQYYAMMITNDDGFFSFKTIKPGTYDATENWVRPPHIHYKFSLNGYEELITQSYFNGEHLNNLDQILQSLPKEEQSKLIINFETNSKNELVGTFNIKLKRR